MRCILGRWLLSKYKLLHQIEMLEKDKKRVESQVQGEQDII